MSSPLPRRTVVTFAALSPGIALGLSGTPAAAQESAAPPPGGTAVHNVVMAVHGGAGSLPRGSITPEQEKAFRDGLEQALRTGAALLADGKPSLDAVEAAVRVLEDDPTFNAGRARSSTPTVRTNSTPRS